MNISIDRRYLLITDYGVVGSYRDVPLIKEAIKELKNGNRLVVEVMDDGTIKSDVRVIEDHTNGNKEQQTVLNGFAALCGTPNSACIQKLMALGYTYLFRKASGINHSLVIYIHFNENIKIGNKVSKILNNILILSRLL